MLRQQITRYPRGGAVTSLEATQLEARWLVPPVFFRKVQVPPMQGGWERVAKGKVPGDLPILTTKLMRSGKAATNAGPGVGTANPPGSIVSKQMAAAIARANQMRGYGSGR